MQWRCIHLIFDNKIFCLSLHYNDENSYLFVNGQQVINFKAKNSELKKHPMCLGGISKDYIKIVVKAQCHMEMFMTFVLIIMLLQMMEY